MLAAYASYHLENIWLTQGRWTHRLGGSRTRLGGEFVIVYFIKAQLSSFKYAKKGSFVLAGVEH